MPHSQWEGRDSRSNVPSSLSAGAWHYKWICVIQKAVQCKTLDIPTLQQVFIAGGKIGPVYMYSPGMWLQIQYQTQSMSACFLFFCCCSLGGGGGGGKGRLCWFSDYPFKISIKFSRKYRTDSKLGAPMKTGLFKAPGENCHFGISGQ